MIIWKVLATVFINLKKIPNNGNLKVIYENGTVKNIIFDGVFYNTELKSKRFTWNDPSRIYGEYSSIGPHTNLKYVKPFAYRIK